MLVILRCVCTTQPVSSKFGGPCQCRARYGCGLDGCVVSYFPSMECRNHPRNRAPQTKFECEFDFHFNSPGDIQRYPHGDTSEATLLLCCLACSVAPCLFALHSPEDESEACLQESHDQQRGCRYCMKSHIWRLLVSHSSRV